MTQKMVLNLEKFKEQFCEFDPRQRENGGMVF
jgi:hypothetical protein